MCDNLPEVVLKHIFCFVGNAWDFRCCERTCQTFRSALEDDAVWGSCEECQPQYQDQQQYWPTENREKAFVVRALDQCHRWQRSSEGVLRSVLTVREWKHLVDQALKLLVLDDLAQDEVLVYNQPPPFTVRAIVKCCDTFPLRGDTSAMLMALVENCLVQQLQRANSAAVFLSLQTPKTQETEAVYSHYPGISIGAFAFQDHMLDFNNSSSEDTERGGTGFHLTVMPNQEIHAIASTISRDLDLDRQKRHVIVRRLAYRAGVTKLEDDAFDLIWSQLVYLTVKLLEPGCIALASRDRCDPFDGGRQMLRSMETMRTIPPRMEFAPTICPTCNRHQVVHTIVPRQIEEAAKQLGIAKHVYCAEWHVETESENNADKKQQLMEQEIAKAQSKYCLVPEPVDQAEGTEASDCESFYSAKEEEDALDGLSDVSQGEIADLQAEAAAIGDRQEDADEDASEEDTSLAGVGNNDSHSYDSDIDDESYIPEDTSDEEDLDLKCYEAEDEDVVGALGRQEVLVTASFGEHIGPAFSRDMFVPV